LPVIEEEKVMNDINELELMSNIFPEKTKENLLTGKFKRFARNSARIVYITYNPWRSI
jgi:hypothetical protein